MFYNYYFFDGENSEDEYSYYYDENGTWIKISDELIDYIVELNNSLTEELVQKFHDEYQLGKRDSFDAYVKKIKAQYLEKCKWHEENKDKFPPPTPLVSKLESEV